MTTDELKLRVAKIPYWYHRIELPAGDGKTVVTPGWAPINADRYSIPKDLTGKRVLDIGAWDGYWTWEALKRGAKEVVAIDDFSDDCGAPNRIKRQEWKSFDLCREAFGFTTPGSEIEDRWLNDRDQAVTRRRASIYGIYPTLYGQFDVVFFFGTIYHLQHPLMALERISAVCSGALYVETASLDEYSPYRGGIGKGFSQNEMVMEFYPGAEYGSNPGNWWAPTLQCLGAMMASVGFQDVECWPLVERPTKLAECRGFASGTKDPAREPACHPPDLKGAAPAPPLRIAAVESVPRLGFMDNRSCLYEALTPLRIPVISVQGAFWGQCLERGIQQMVDSGIDIVLTIDYDTVFNRQDVEAILGVLCDHPEAAAVVPVQRGRGEFPILMSMKTLTGQPRSKVPITEMKPDVVKIASGHFGLTAIRVKDLLDVPHPWFWDQPNCDGQWGPGRIDADIWFWKQLERAGKTVLLANRVTVGHLELMVKWPDQDLAPMYQTTSDFHEKGKPGNCWK
jgi:tRNA (mo5U34)-methyltransferase